MIGGQDDDMDASQGGGDAIDSGPDPAFAALLGEVGEHIDDSLQRATVPWDFAAMLARARAIDPSAVSEAAVREAELAEPVISLAQRRASRSTRDDPEFERLVQDVRAATEHDAALRSNGIATTSPGTARTSGRSRGVVVAMLAIAAAVVLVFGAVRGVQFFDLGGGGAPAEAVHQDGGLQTTVHEAVVEDEPTTPVRTSARPDAVSPTPPPQPAVVPATPEVEHPPVPAEVKVAARPRRKSQPETPIAPTPTIDDQQRALSNEGEAAMKAGDLALAASKFEAVIALSGMSRLADLAWGDLFNIARRRGDTTGEVDLWKRYLASRPRGKFADDARAGLCRRDAADKAACWRAYLADFPEGVHVKDAQRATGGTP